MTQQLTISKQMSRKLVYLRESNDLTVEQVASHLGIKSTELSALEMGNSSKFDQKLLEKIATIFQVPVSYITDETVKDDASYGFLARAMEKLSQNDHDEIVKFADFLKSTPRGK